MMKTQRERFLVLVVPATLVLLLYGWFWHSPQMRELRAKDAQIEKARASSTSRGKLAEKQAALKALKAEVARLEADIKDNEHQLAAGDQQLGSTLPLTEASRKLTEMLVMNQVSVETAGVSSQSESAQVLSASLKATVERLKSKPNFKEPTLYRIKFWGHYDNVSRALKEIADQRIATPLQLQMDEAKPETSWRSWTMFVWL